MSIPYVREAGALLLLAALAGTHWWAWNQGGKSAALEAARKENKALEAAVAERDAAIAQRNEAQAKADKLAALPPKVVESVRNNPSGCTLPRPVTDSLREQVRQTNAALP